MSGAAQGDANTAKAVVSDRKDDSQPLAPQKQAAQLEEDDEFEDFPVEGAFLPHPRAERSVQSLRLVTEKQQARSKRSRPARYPHQRYVVRAAGRSGAPRRDDTLGPAALENRRRGLCQPAGGRSASSERPGKVDRS
ncbi:MAG: hypothetical protein EOO77_16440, partial [Oxalobacteraceae bacterium]